MQLTLDPTAQTLTLEEKLWLRAALKECIAYGEHALDTDITEEGVTICLNCSNAL